MNLEFIWVALGSALGGVLRFGLSMRWQGDGRFPWVTLFINVVGALVIGILCGWLARHGGSYQASIRAFAVVGFCGGFTTFSTFSNETFHLIEGGSWGLAIVYMGASCIAGLFAVGLGTFLARG